MAVSVPDEDRHDAFSNYERQCTGGITSGDHVTYKDEVHFVTAVRTFQGKISLRLANAIEEWVPLNEVQRVSDAA